MGEDKKRCPQCGGHVDWSLTCHTYPSTRADGSVQWMACLPCDSATDWFCVGSTPEWDVDDECDWRFTEGLNPKNPRAADNERHRPSWLAAQENSAEENR